MDDCHATVSAAGYAMDLFGGPTQLAAYSYQFGTGGVGCKAIASQDHILMDFIVGVADGLGTRTNRHFGHYIHITNCGYPCYASAPRGGVDLVRASYPQSRGRSSSGRGDQRQVFKRVLAVDIKIHPAWQELRYSL